MKEYQKLIDQVKHHEGLVLHGYRDSRGYLTIGYGRLIDEELGGGITEGEAETLLLNDLSKVILEARQFDWYDGLNEPRKAVIVSMIFNLGFPRFSKFVNTIGFLEEGLFVEASEEMLNSKWAHQVGNRAIMLSRQMATGEWQED